MFPRIFLACSLVCLLNVAWAETPDRKVPQRGERSEGPGTGSLNTTTAREALRVMIQRITQENPAILAAEAAVAAARARADAADQPLYNPTLSVDTENGQSTVTAAGISQTLDWSGKRASRQNVAMRELQAARAELAVTLQRVTAETLAALAEYQTAREQVTLAEQRSRLMREFAETATRRLAAGDISRLDAALAQVALNEALMQQARAAAALSGAEAALSAVSGLAPRETWPSFPEEPIPPQENINVDALLDRLPEIQLSLAKAAAAQERIGLAKQQRRPDPTLSVRGGRDGSDALIGVGIEIPLFVRNSFRAEVAAAVS